VENVLKAPRSTFRHLCVIARHELNAHPHASYADVVEATKMASARARIPYHDVHKAIDAVVASTKYRFHDPTTERRSSEPIIPDTPPPAIAPRPRPQPAHAVMTADGTVLRRSWESPSSQMAKARLPPAAQPLSLSDIVQELAKRGGLTPERTRDDKAS
jgi:hypothetical protein